MQDQNIAATKECPYCAERINAASKKCRYCNEILDQQMRDVEMLKWQRNNSNVYMNSGGAAASSSSSSSSSSSGDLAPLNKFPHWMHILLSIFTGGLWLPIYILMYIFRNKRHYY